VAGREPSAEERAAAAIVAALGGTAEHQDGPRASDGSHDYDVLLPDWTCIALEVTRAVDKDTNKLFDAAFGKKWPGKEWRAPGLANDWKVSLPARPIKVTRVMREIASILAVFEQHADLARGSRLLAWRPSPNLCGGAQADTPWLSS
jgi:hypothetical protein